MNPVAHIQFFINFAKCDDFNCNNTFLCCDRLICSTSLHMFL